MLEEKEMQVLEAEADCSCAGEAEAGKDALPAGEAECGGECMAKELEALRALVSEQAMRIAELKGQLPWGIIEAVTPSEAADDPEDGFLWGLSR